MITYNAEILERLGLPLPSAEWTWDDFFSYCRRGTAGGISPHSPWTPNGMDCGIVAEPLGATPDDVEPLREATDFVHRWRAEGLAHPEPKDRKALLPSKKESSAFLVIQQGRAFPSDSASMGCARSAGASRPYRASGAPIRTWLTRFTTWWACPLSRQTRSPPSA